MSDFICPVCGAYGVTTSEKASLRLYGHTINCQGCGAQLTLALFESLVTYVMIIGCIAISFIFSSSLAQVSFIVFGVVASLYWHIKFVPLVQTGRHISPG